MLEEKKEIPTWAKMLFASSLGAGSIGGITSIPINYGAQDGYVAVQGEFKEATIEVRTWRPYIFRVTDADGKVTIVETSMNGTIVDRW